MRQEKSTKIVPKMTNTEVFYAMMEEFKQVLDEHTKLTAQRDEMMQEKIDSLMFQIKEEVDKIQDKEFLNNELKAEIEAQKLLIYEKNAKIQEQEILLKEMELERNDLIAEIESQKLHMDEKDKMINEQSDMISEQAELINDQIKCTKNANRLRMENEGIRLKNNIAKKEIDNLRAELQALSTKFRMSSIHSIQSQQKYLQIKELYQESQKNWVDAIDVYFKQIESMNEYIETLHAGNEESTMLQLLEQSIEGGTVEDEEETVRHLSPIPEEDEDAYEESDQEQLAESDQEESVATVEEGEVIDEEEMELTENEEILLNGEEVINELHDVKESAEIEKEIVESSDTKYSNGASTFNAKINYFKDSENEKNSTTSSNIEKLICDEEIVIHDELKDEGIEINNETNLSNIASNGN